MTPGSPTTALRSTSARGSSFRISGHVSVLTLADWPMAPVVGSAVVDEAPPLEEDGPLEHPTCPAPTEPAPRALTRITLRPRTALRQIDFAEYPIDMVDTSGLAQRARSKPSSTFRTGGVFRALYDARNSPRGEPTLRFPESPFDLW